MQYCRPEDLCIFKLDIDTSSAELAINSQLLKSPQIMAVVDEYYFEHHVHNQVMAIHGDLGGRPKTSAKKESLVLRLREEGESYRSIKEQTGLALATITRIVKEAEAVSC